MNDQNKTTPFPQTGQDIANLKQTATDAAAKVKGHITDLQSHIQSETGDQIQRAKQSLVDVLDSAKSRAAEHLFVTVAIAVGVGFFLGRTRSA